MLALAAFGPPIVVRAQDEVQAEDWPRFYIGIALGESNWRVDMSEGGLPENYVIGGSIESDNALKIVAGYRPIRFVGVEIQAIDFGEGKTNAQGGTAHDGGGQVGIYYDKVSRMSASSDARVLSALLFAPESLRLVDVYGKVGVAVFDESLTVHGFDAHSPGCMPPTTCAFDNQVYQSDSHAYAGIGARFKIARAGAVRIEYEAVDRDGEDPTTLLSLGVALEF